MEEVKRRFIPPGTCYGCQADCKTWNEKLERWTFNNWCNDCFQQRIIDGLCIKPGCDNWVETPVADTLCPRHKKRKRSNRAKRDVIPIERPLTQKEGK